MLSCSITPCNASCGVLSLCPASVHAPAKVLVVSHQARCLLRPYLPAHAVTRAHLTASLCQLQVHASLIVVLTRGGSTARLVAKYRPSIPVLTVAVPVLTTDSLTWTCSGEAPARQTLITRGLLPLLAEGSARATDTDTTDEILQVHLPAWPPLF